MQSTKISYKYNNIKTRISFFQLPPHTKKKVENENVYQ